MLTNVCGVFATEPYIKRFPLDKCKEIIRTSLKRGNVTTDRITDENRQRFWQALGPLRRKAARRVVYKLAPKALILKNTKDRQDESCSAAELRRGSKTVVYPSGMEPCLVDDQREFFREVDDEDGDFVKGRLVIDKTVDFKTPCNLAVADGNPERKFIRELTKTENAKKLAGWLKNTAIGFYSIEHAWKKGNTPKRGEFSPDYFIKQGDQIFVVEIKGDDEAIDPAIDNVKKYEYAAEHFRQLNEWLANGDLATRYQFNMLSPKGYNAFFQKLRDGELVGFRSDLDVAMKQAITSDNESSRKVHLPHARSDVT